ncbi:MAG: Flp pilus assembly complex ATPase component TadA [Bacteriovoracaceae bacterium]|nr:Flp pilus assembly complex ATPase component TadA [Bacteriovoracaceae bacterium]
MFALKDYEENKKASHNKEQLLDCFKISYRSLVNHKRNFSYQHVLEHSLNRLNLDFKESETDENLLSWFNKVYHFKRLELFDIEDLEEIIFHRPNYVQIIQAGKSQFNSIDLGLSQNDYNLSLETQCLKNGVEWNYSKPFASFKTQIGNLTFRLSLIHSSAQDGIFHKAFFRLISKSSFPLSNFTSDQETSEYIISLINQKKNILISGSTGSGKTSFIKSSLFNNKQDEHLIILEDTRELTNEFPHYTCLLSKDDESYSLKKYCEYAMRMRPDRIILGEMRGAEVVPFLLNMNNGHKGLMSTIHANSSIDAVSRVALLFELYSESKSITYEQVLKLITSNLDYVIHIENKKVVDISKIIGFSDGQIRFENIYSSKRNP